MFTIKNGSEVWQNIDTVGSKMLGKFNGTAEAQKVADAMNRPLYMFQVWNAGNDNNGNPRRVTLVYAPTGSTVAAFADNYDGDHIPRGGVTLPGVDCTAKTWSDALGDEEYRTVARRYLDASHPTAIEHIGREALKGEYQSKLFRDRIRACGGNVKHLDAIRSAIWTVEEHRQQGIAWPASDRGVAKDPRS